MSQQSIEYKTFVAYSEITQFQRVQLRASTGDNVEPAGTGNCIGIAQGNASAGEWVVVALISRGRTFKALVHDIVEPGSWGYGYTSGTINSTRTESTTDFFYFLEATYGSDVVAEVLPIKP